MESAKQHADQEQNLETSCSRIPTMYGTRTAALIRLAPRPFDPEISGTVERREGMVAAVPEA